MRFSSGLLLMKGIIVGILVIGCGVAVIYFHQDLYKLFGDIEWVEQYLGDSRAIYPLIGAGLITLGVLLMFGIGAGSSPTDINTGFGE